MKRNNAHIAYLRRLEETMRIRARRLAIVDSIHSKQDPRELARLKNKHLACLRWEQIHGTV